MYKSSGPVAISYWAFHLSNNVVTRVDLCSNTTDTPEMLEDGTVGVHHEILNDTKHTVAKVGDTLIDWTRRQFEPESNFPYIYSIHT